MLSCIIGIPCAFAMNTTYNLIISTVIVFAIVTTARSQIPSQPTELQPPVGVSFQWRLLRWDDASQKNEAEMVFGNITDSTIAFSYVIGTNKNEELRGRMTLHPHRQNLFGWLLAGRITRVESNTIEYKASTDRSQKSEPIRR